MEENYELIYKMARSREKSLNGFTENLTEVLKMLEEYKAANDKADFDFTDLQTAADLWNIINWGMRLDETTEEMTRKFLMKIKEDWRDKHFSYCKCYSGRIMQSKILKTIEELEG